MTNDNQLIISDSNTINKRNDIGLLGFILAIGSILTCGLSAIPGLICSIIGIKKKSYRILSWIGVIFSVLIVCYILIYAYIFFNGMPSWIPDPIKRSYVNSRLSLCSGYQNVRNTSLPDSAKNIHILYSGLFCKFMYLRFNATKDDAEKMFRDFGVTEPTIIGNGNGEKQMVSWNEYYELHKKSFDNNIEFDENHYVKESTLDWLPWWTPTKIKKGKAFRLNILPGKPIRDGGPTAAAPTGFGIYYDEDTGTIYFCWNYS